MRRRLFKLLSGGLIVLVIVFLVFIFLSGLGTFILASALNTLHLHSILTSSDWKEYRDETLGITFQHPSAWYAPRIIEKSSIPYGISYELFFSGDFVHITLSKVSDDHIIDSLAQDPKYETEKILVNNIEFTVFHNKHFYRDQNLKTEGLFYNQDRKLLISVQNGQTTDGTLWERQEADKIISRVINSIKSI